MQRRTSIDELAQQPQEQSPTSVFSEAIKYLSRGWFVVPAHPAEKRPLVTYKHRIHLLPSTSEWQKWIKKWPECGVGLVTGTPSGGVILVDIDEEATFRALKLHIPATRVVRSANRQLPHYYWHAKRHVKCRHTSWGDIKGEGGFAMVPPSPGYLVDCDVPVADAPEWIYGHGEKTEKTNSRPRSRSAFTRSLKRVMRWGVRKGERAVQGCRIAFTLARNGQEHWNEAWDFLLAWNCKNKPPLTDQEVQHELASKARESFDRGLAHRHHAAQLTSRSQFRKKAARNRIVAFLKGARWQPSLSDIADYTHVRAKKARRILTQLARTGWVVFIPKGRGHRVMWTGKGRSCWIEDLDYGAIEHIKPRQGWKR